MSTPNWQAATSAQPPLAAHINQLLGTHLIVPLYTGVQTAAVTTNGATTTNSNSLYMAQSFTTAVGQTTVGYVSIPLSTTTTTGSSLGTISVGLYANSAGAPTGSALVSTTVTAEYSNFLTSGTTTVYIFVPLPVTGLSASTTYWIVTGAVGTVTNFYAWRRSASASGASTSPDGVTWTAQAYGLQYQVFDRTASGSKLFTWEDSGVRWTYTSYNSNSSMNTYSEYTVGQTATGYLQSNRSFTYSNGSVTVVQ